MNRTLYATLIALRDAEWDQTGDDTGAEDPKSSLERYWYRQGRAEAFAEVMSLLEHRS